MQVFVGMQIPEQQLPGLSEMMGQTIKEVETNGDSTLCAFQIKSKRGDVKVIFSSLPL